MVFLVKPLNRKFQVKKILVLVLPIALYGCASSYTGPSSDATALATDQFRKDMLELSRLTINTTKNANNILRVKKSQTDILDQDDLGSLENIAQLAYLDGVSVSTFKNLIENLAQQCDYEFLFTTDDLTILNKTIVINAKEIRIIDAIYTAHEKFGDTGVDITINTKTKRIVISDYKFSGGGLRQLEGSPSIIRE